MAIVALCGFVAGRRLRASATCARGDRSWDMRSYVAIHLSIILGVGVLVDRLDLGARRPGATGGSGTSRCWSRSWSCSCCTASTTRCASRSRTRSARRATRRCSRSRPARSCRSTSSPSGWRRRTRTRACSRRPAASMPGEMRLTFLVALVGDRAAVRDALEARADRQARVDAAEEAVAEARMPALPLDEAGKYVAGAYVVFVALILIYVAIIGAKIARIERELTRAARRRTSDRRAARARRLAQDGAAAAARAARAAGGPRRARAGRAVRARRRSTRPSRSPPATAPSSTSSRRTRSRPRTPRSAILSRQAELRPTELLGALYSLRGSDAVRAPLLRSPPGSTR